MHLSITSIEISLSRHRRSEGGCAPLRLAAAALIAAACTARATAQETSRNLFWNLKGGLGVSYHLHDRNSDERQLIFVPELLKSLGRHWEYVLEGHVSRLTSPPGYLVGVFPVGMRYLPLVGSVRPFVSVGAGLAWTDLTNIPEISRHFNLLAEGDVGVRWSAHGSRSWQVSARLLHISNGGAAEPNLGLNVVILLVGWRIP